MLKNKVLIYISSVMQAISVISAIVFFILLFTNVNEDFYFILLPVALFLPTTSACMLYLIYKSTNVGFYFASAIQNLIPLYCWFANIPLILIALCSKEKRKVLNKQFFFLKSLSKKNQIIFTLNIWLSVILIISLAVFSTLVFDINDCAGIIDLALLDLFILFFTYNLITKIILLNSPSTSKKYLFIDLFTLSFLNCNKYQTKK